MKIFRENKKVFIIFIISFLLAIVANIVFFTVGGTSFSLFILQILSLINFFIQLKNLAKVLAKYIKIKPSNKIKKAMLRVANLFSALFGAFAKITNTINERAKNIFGKLISRGNGPLLRRYNDEMTYIKNEKNRLGNRLRKMKWRNLETNRDRIRFIYIAFLKKQIKAGAPISLADTPNELYVKLQEKNNELEDALFSLYNVARYNNEDDSITTEDVEMLRRK